MEQWFALSPTTLAVIASSAAADQLPTLVQDRRDRVRQVLSLPPPAAP